MPSRPAAAGIASYRPAVLCLGRILGIGLSSVAAAPLEAHHHGDADEHAPEDGGTPTWVLAVASMALVLLGGIFAGLTIA
jgi:hypothetical protein